MLSCVVASLHRQALVAHPYLHHGSHTTCLSFFSADFASDSTDSPTYNFVPLHTTKLNCYWGSSTLLWWDSIPFYLYAILLIRDKGKYLWEPLLPSRCTLDCLLYFKINKKVNKQHSEHQSTCSAHYITKHQQVAHCIMKWQQVNCKINKNVINKKVNIKTSWNSDTRIKQGMHSSQDHNKKHTNIGICSNWGILVVCTLYHH